MTNTPTKSASRKGSSDEDIVYKLPMQADDLPLAHTRGRRRAASGDVGTLVASAFAVAGQAKRHCEDSTTSDSEDEIEEMVPPAPLAEKENNKNGIASAQTDDDNDDDDMTDTPERVFRTMCGKRRRRPFLSATNDETPVKRDNEEAAAKETVASPTRGTIPPRPATKLMPEAKPSVLAPAAQSQRDVARTDTTTKATKDAPASQAALFLPKEGPKRGSNAAALGPTTNNGKENAAAKASAAPWSFSPRKATATPTGVQGQAATETLSLPVTQLSSLIQTLQQQTLFSHQTNQQLHMAMLDQQQSLGKVIRKSHRHESDSEDDGEETATSDAIPCIPRSKQADAITDITGCTRVNHFVGQQMRRHRHLHRYLRPRIGNDKLLEEDDDNIIRHYERALFAAKSHLKAKGFYFENFVELKVLEHVILEWLIPMLLFNRGLFKAMGRKTNEWIYMDITSQKLLGLMEMLLSMIEKSYSKAVFLKWGVTGEAEHYMKKAASSAATVSNAPATDPVFGDLWHMDWWRGNNIIKQQFTHHPKGRKMNEVFVQSPQQHQLFWAPKEKDTQRSRGRGKGKDNERGKHRGRGRGQRDDDTRDAHPGQDPAS